MTFVPSKSHLRPQSRDNPRTAKSRFEALEDVSMEEVRQFIRDYQPWSTASLYAARKGHDQVDSPSGPRAASRNLPLPEFLESDRTYTGFTVQVREGLGRGKPPAKRFGPKDDLWPARAFAAHLLARKLRRALEEYKAAGGRPAAGVTLIAKRIAIDERIVLLCVVDPKAAVPDLMGAICNESIEEKALKRHKRLFFQLRPWLRKTAHLSTGFDESWPMPQVSSYHAYPWVHDGYTGSADRYFEALIRAFLKKPAKQPE